MKLTLFSQNLNQSHIDKLRSFIPKPFEGIKFLYINTAGNYKPYKSDWMIEGERKWQKIFPLFQEFDPERAFRVNQNFDFKTFLSSYDYIFISGGNTFVLSYWMDKTGCTEILRDLIMSDKIVYGGESAGTVFTTKDISFCAALDNPEKAPEQINTGLGLLGFIPLPHWGNEEFQNGLESIKDNFDKNNTEVKVITDDQALFCTHDSTEII